MHIYVYRCVYMSAQSSCSLWWIQLLPVVCRTCCTRITRPSSFVRLLAVLLFLLLELPEMGLDGGGGLLDLNGAERGSGVRGACPIAGIGVWARQDTGYSQRGWGNSHVDIVCSNDWVQTHSLHISLSSSGLFFWSRLNAVGFYSYSNQTRKNSLRLT